MSRDDAAGRTGPQAKSHEPARRRSTANGTGTGTGSSTGTDRPNGNTGNDGSNPSRFANLPDPVLTQIFQLLANTSPRDLCSVSLVNKKWHDIADSILYKDVLFAKPEHHLVFGESLTRRERRGSAIHFASLEYPTSELSHLSLNGHIASSHYTPEHFDSLSRTISTMSNLQELEISVPVTLLHGIGALFNGPFDLACLKSCSLFYQCPDNAYWDLRENIHIFAHPTLETLFIRRAKLDYRGFDFNERPHELPLKQLHLIECDISDDALGDVLELPKGLKEFVMTQSAKPTPDLEESSDNMGDYIVALQSQCESLEKITIDSPTLGSRRSLRMRDFNALKILRVNWDWQLFGKSSKKPRLDSFGVPPHLERLEFFNELGTDDEVTELLDYLIQTNDVAAKAVKSTPVDSVNKKLARMQPLLPRNRRDSYTITLA
ncbi:F-box domain-containing protein [Xylaria flabelliformis]|nr:F-box domain-containing protein [Xylaria flabelliformis]